MKRSTTVGVIRARISALLETSTVRGTIAPTRAPTEIASTTPDSAMPALRCRRRGQPIGTASAVPIRGTISGAISIAPITTAVDSTTTPTDAMTDAKPISARNRAYLVGALPPSK